MKMELRVNPMKIEANEDGTLTVSGYVNKTEQFSNLLGRTQRFKEKISKGAFDRAISKADEIHFLAEHDNNKILASTRNGSLSLTEDEQGLYMTANISPTSWGKDYYQLVKDGILRHMSFGFRAVKDSWRNLGDHLERTVSELELFEVSIVRDPAYSQSSISARGIDLVEDVEIPDEVRNDIEIKISNFEIRTEADVEAIAKKLFEMLQSSVKVAERPEDKPAEEVKTEEKPADEIIEEGKVEDIQPEVETKTEDENADEKTDEVTDEQKVEDKVEDEKVEEVVEQTGAEKLRDFINKYKQEDNQ